MWSVLQKTHNRLILLVLLILISNSFHTTKASETVIARKTEEITIPDTSIKCDTCPCDTCPEPVPPPPPPPAMLPECPPPPPPLPPPCPPPPSPSPSPPPPTEPCDPCTAHSPPPLRFYYTPNTPNLYVTEYNYSGGSRVKIGVVVIVVFVGVALLQLIIWV